MLKVAEISKKKLKMETLNLRAGEGKESEIFQTGKK